jgi:hypothetical protein
MVMAHTHNEALVNHYIVQNTVPAGPGHRPNYLEREPAGPRDAEFALWWSLNGANVQGYVARAREWGADRLEPGVRGLRQELESLGRRDGSQFDHDLHHLLCDCSKWRGANWRTEMAIERLWDAPAFTREERRRWRAEIALYRRADAWHRLLAAFQRDLEGIQFTGAVAVAASLASHSHRLAAWLAV